ncbi:hypothetical protein Tco_1492451 [Tanacetum coccineum]
MDQIIKHDSVKEANDRKRKLEDKGNIINNNYQNNYNNNNRNNDHHQQQNRKQETFRTYTTTNGYTGNSPLCERCTLHHIGSTNQSIPSTQVLSESEEILLAVIKRCGLGAPGTRYKAYEWKYYPGKRPISTFLLLKLRPRIQTARDRQKSYADLKRKPMEFQVGDKAMLKVLKKIRAVAYKLELPQELSRVHNTFHVSNLKNCYSDDPLVVLLEGLQEDDKLHFVEESVEIMDREVKQLRRSRVPIAKVRWNSRRGPEFTWEQEDQFRKKYPHLFTKIAPSSSAVS